MPLTALPLAAVVVGGGGVDGGHSNDGGGGGGGGGGGDGGSLVVVVKSPLTPGSPSPAAAPSGREVVHFLEEAVFRGLLIFDREGCSE